MEAETLKLFGMSDDKQNMETAIKTEMKLEYCEGLPL
jgi:hypothetical protein